MEKAMPQPTTMAGGSKRNYGVDLLRIISMVMIAILHVSGHGGILKGTVTLSAGYEVAWFLELASYCAVNCYALISGYVGCGSTKFKYSGIVALWLQTTFYAVSIAALAAYFLPDVGWAQVFKAFLPVTNNTYWYFTAYFCMYFFTPLLNKVVQELSEKQLKAVAVTIFVLFSVIPTLCRKDLFHVNGGYAALWLALLYILGGAIKKCNPFSKVKSIWFILGYFVFTTITWAEKLFVDMHNSGGGEKIKSFLESYTSPTVLLAAVTLLMGFSKINPGKIATALIKFFASFSFSVYLIHDNPYVRAYVVKKTFPSFVEFDAVTLGFAVLGSAVAIYLLGSVIDFLREKIFDILHIKQLLAKAENKIFKDLWTNGGSKAKNT